MTKQKLRVLFFTRMKLVVCVLASALAITRIKWTVLVSATKFHLKPSCFNFSRLLAFGIQAIIMTLNHCIGSSILYFFQYDGLINVRRLNFEWVSLFFHHKRKKYVHNKRHIITMFYSWLYVQIELNYSINKKSWEVRRQW